MKSNGVAVVNIMYAHVYITCDHIALLAMFESLHSNSIGTCTCIADLKHFTIKTITT